jgi:hypothetical protein
MIGKRRTLYRQWVPLGAALVLSFCILAPAWSADKLAKAKTPDIEPKAEQVLKQMCDYLKNLQQFSVQAEITEDVLLTSGQRIQYARSVEASVRRPDRFRAESVGDTQNGLNYAGGFSYPAISVCCTDISIRTALFLDAVPPSV